MNINKYKYTFKKIFLTGWKKNAALQVGGALTVYCSLREHTVTDHWQTSKLWCFYYLAQLLRVYLTFRKSSLAKPLTTEPIGLSGQR